MHEYKINLAENTISQDELVCLADWIKSGARLTKGELTKKFEKEFAAYIGVQHAVFVNSGSSANLLMLYALMESGQLRNRKAIIPAVSWITTLSPFIQFGFEPHLCEADKRTLGMDVDHFEDLCKKFQPAVAIVVHVLGHACEMEAISSICQKYDVVLLEDACEALGTTYNGKKLGSLGAAGSFSFYYGHHISTIEGGMVTTSDNQLYNTMLSIRSHGWSRDVESVYQEKWKQEFDVDEVREYYTFYYPGFNLRSTDLNAFVGISQLARVDQITRQREMNFWLYKKRLADKFYCQNSTSDNLSSFAYGTMVENRVDVHRHLLKHGIETRPLICGSMAKQPFWVKKYGAISFENADLIHDYGIYLPNHLALDDTKINHICDKFLEIAQPV